MFFSHTFRFENCRAFHFVRIAEATQVWSQPEFLWRCRGDIRIAVHILAFYCGKTNIGAIVSWQISFAVTKHSHRIAFCVVNSAFFENVFGRGNLDKLFFARPGAHHPAQIFESTKGDNKTTIFLEKNAAPDVGEKLQVQMAANFGGHIFCDDRRRASQRARPVVSPISW